ncbi:OLC1v1005190C3 [Oldenlandia corymbosa var. corymbosa]|uniref:OLC1v1005190C3 n=1 Tax=Oldenlandia corymbosa var. corymbosa TaxID=529605 RepID=A0AAV1DE40_OLDCO|nr:OLC1v1005190C3 [Oldenlandia corymbosa var. corymbosa]
MTEDAQVNSLNATLPSFTSSASYLSATVICCLPQILVEMHNSGQNIWMKDSGMGWKEMIIEPLASRYAKFRFKPLTEEIMSKRILHRCQEQGLNLDPEALSSLTSIAQGDLRRAITYLQFLYVCILLIGKLMLQLSSSFLDCHYGARIFGSYISSQELISVSGALHSACRSGNFDLADKGAKNVIAEGYPVSQVLSQLFDIIVQSDDITDEQKSRICKKLAEADKCLVDGADEYLQLLDVTSNTMRAICNLPEQFSYESLVCNWPLAGKHGGPCMNLESGKEVFNCISLRVYPIRPPVPAVAGYEGVGEVHCVGSGVKGLSAGDWVIPFPPPSGLDLMK